MRVPVSHFVRKKAKRTIASFFVGKQGINAYARCCFNFYAKSGNLNILKLFATENGAIACIRINGTLFFCRSLRDL